MQKEFDSLVDLFKNLSTEEKKDALIKEFKVNLAALQKINNDIGVKREVLFNKEIFDVNKEDATEDDYLEAYFVYLHMLNDSFNSFATKIIEDYFD